MQHEIVSRKSEAEFVRRGLAAIARTREDGSGIPADAVIAKLEARLAAVRKALAQKKTPVATRQR